MGSVLFWKLSIINIEIEMETKNKIIESAGWRCDYQSLLVALDVKLYRVNQTM